MEKTNFGDCVNVYLAPIWGLKWEVAGDKGRFITMAFVERTESELLYVRRTIQWLK